MFKKQSETRGKQTALIEEMIGNQKVVKAFGYEDKASKRFDEINKELKEYSQKAVFYSSLTNPSTRFVNNIIYAAVALAGAFLIPLGALTVGGLSVLLSYANQYMKPFNDITSVITEMQNALACATRIFDLLEEPEEVNDSSEVLEKVDGNVDIDHIDFSYDKSKSLIEDFNLQVESGMRIAIVGPTGCGKTTFINLLMRFYDVDSENRIPRMKKSSGQQKRQKAGISSADFRRDLIPSCMRTASARDRNSSCVSQELCSVCRQC